MVDIFYVITQVTTCSPYCCTLKVQSIHKFGFIHTCTFLYDSQTFRKVYSGATCHIACSLYIFSHNHMVDNVFITLPDKSLTHLHSIKSVCLNTHLTLHNGLYIPSFHATLFLLVHYFLITTYPFSLMLTPFLYKTKASR